MSLIILALKGLEFIAQQSSRDCFSGQSSVEMDLKAKILLIKSVSWGDYLTINSIQLQCFILIVYVLQLLNCSLSK